MSDHHILFLCTRNAVRSQMAEGFARAYAPAGVHVYSAGMHAAHIHPLTVEIMREEGIDISTQRAKTMDVLDTTHFDLIVTLCEHSRDSCPIFPGSPATVHWAVPDPVAAAPSARDHTNTHETALYDAFRTIAKTIRELTCNLFKQGYFEAFVQQKQNTENILDAISDGIVAYDQHRIIFLFSKGAQRLSGYSASEVIGKDCCKVFHPHLFGKQCIFEPPPETPSTHSNEYSSFLIDKSGTRREIDVSVLPLHEHGHAVGAVAILHDNSEINTLRRRIREEYSFQGIIGNDHTMQQLYELIRDLTQYDFPVCITGETGTGKELVARAIHNESTRKNGPFVPVNCSALPEGTLESELFGHVKGAFTNAIRNKKGRFEIAHTGTLFLDEVAEMSEKTQAKLLRVLQEGTFEPVGSEQSVTVDVRIISATNKNLRDYISRGAFREDLYYRLAVVPIEMPPLRQRRNDIVLLARHFLDRERTRLGHGDVSLSHEARSLLMSYHWPGNVRQLHNAIQFALLKSKGRIIYPRHLPPEIVSRTDSASLESASEPSSASCRSKGTSPHAGPGDRKRPGRTPLLTMADVRNALDTTAGNKARAARLLGVGRATLYNFLTRHPELRNEG
jgi:PAS domain S-box-containing protein